MPLMIVIDSYSTTGARAGMGQLATMTRAGDLARSAPEAGIFEPQNLRQSAVAFHVGG
jgi:hypothetical protein